MCREAKRPRTPAKCQASEAPRALRLAAEDPNVTEPVGVAETAPALDPTDAVAEDVGNELGRVGVPPVREHERHFAAEYGRDLVLVLQETLAVLLAEVGVHLLDARHHCVAVHGLLVPLEEAEDVVGATADGDDGGKGGLEEFIAEILGLARVVRVEQSLPPLFAELFLQVGQLSVVAHDFLLALLQRACSSPTWQRGNAGVFIPGLLLNVLHYTTP